MRRVTLLFHMQVLDVLSPDVPVSVASLFVQFIDAFRTEDGFIYKNELNRAILSCSYVLKVHLSHISVFSQTLFDRIISDPTSCVSEIESHLAKTHCTESDAKFTVHFYSDANHIPIKMITGKLNNKVIRLRGLVLNVSPPCLKVQRLRLICSKCFKAVYSDFMLRSCTSECGMDPYVISEDSDVIPEQSIRVQELFEDIPMGDMPAQVKLCLPKSLIDTVKPGSRIDACGIVCVDDATAMVRVLGLDFETNDIPDFLENEVAVFMRVKNFAHSILQKFTAPHVLGHSVCKQALLCSLFGGSQRTSSGTYLRGDIHTLFLGDPGCAKSALLRFAHAACTRGSIAAGGGSSAAGLTAAIIRKKTGELCLEGGALVNADGGVCCIDEFDKMRETDRVAIHEAMEQQTVTIAKAGICATLRTRCAVVAAANPVFGRYDEFKELADNLCLGRTILSRFDCIFLIKDSHSEEKDLNLARHMLNLTQKRTVDGNSERIDQNDDLTDFTQTQDQNLEIGHENYTVHSGNLTSDQNNSMFNHQNRDYDTMTPEQILNHFDPQNTFKSPLTFLKRYIQYARKVLKPTLTKDAGELLTEYYVKTRKLYAKQQSIPITVRQLESLIRISEALAKMELNEQATTRHVKEAIRIFNESTVEAIQSAPKTHDLFVKQDVKNLSNEILSAINQGHAQYIDALVQSTGSDYDTVRMAVLFLERQGKVALRDSGRTVIRL